MPDLFTLGVVLLLATVVTAVLFVLRQRRTKNPLYDLAVAGRRTFWVAGCAGIIVFGALLTAGYASAMGPAVAKSGEDVTAATQSALQLSHSSAVDLARQYLQYADQITTAAKSSFLKGDTLAYLAGLVAVIIGMALVFFLFQKKAEEERLRAGYRAQDEAAATPGEALPAGEVVVAMAE